MGLFDIAFDGASLSTIAHLADFDAILEKELGSTMQQIGDLVVTAAVANTWEVFKNPTGQLADSIKAVLGGPMVVEIDADVPYARRRELGFDGADSLGRVYHDAPEPYLEPAVSANEDKILQLMGLACAEVWASMGVSI